MDGLDRAAKVRGVGMSGGFAEFEGVATVWEPLDGDDLGEGLALDLIAPARCSSRNSISARTSRSWAPSAKICWTSSLVI